jgi:hypothetical protein
MPKRQHPDEKPDPGKERPTPDTERDPFIGPPRPADLPPPEPEKRKPGRPPKLDDEDWPE